MGKSQIENITNIIQTVDISIAMSGETVIELCKKNKVSLQTLSQRLGLEYLRDIVKETIKDYSDSFFFEYSILSSVLDAQNKDCLISLVCINDDSTEKVLKNKIESEIGNVLAKFTDDNEKNWFHNPELFIAPSKININVSYSNDLNVEENDKRDGTEKKVFGEYDNAARSIANFSYTRSFENIIDAVQKIKKNNGNVEEAQSSGHKELHQLYDCNFFNKHNIQSDTCYISFPVLGAKSGKSPKAYKDVVKDMQGQGVFFLYIQLKDKDKLAEFQQNIDQIKTDLFVQIGDMIRLFSYNYIFNNGLKLVEQVRQKSIQSAISAIMSRNMSHNLGSHFITNTKNYIAKEAERMNSADLRGIRHVLQYTQERMDYIATIVSGDQYPLGALNVKAQLFDELTIDDFAERHSTPTNPKTTTNFFLKYLVYSEKYTIGEAKDGDFRNIHLCIKYDKKIFTGKNDLFNPEENIKLELSQLNLAVPGGVMARHALFNIVENIMRNSAKHSKESTGDLVITLEINEVKPDNNCKRKRDKNNLFHIRIYDNKGNYSEVEGEVKKRLNDIQTLTDEGVVNKENKGLKEMLICVLWLQNEDVSKVLSEIDSLPHKSRYGKVSEYFRIANCDENFGYEFELPVWEKEHEIENEEELKSEGLLEICADVVRPKTKDIVMPAGTSKQMSDIFPRFLSYEDYSKISNKSEVEIFKKASENVFGNIDFDKYIIDIKSDKTSDSSGLEDAPFVIIGKTDNKYSTDKEYKHIVFHNHLYLKDFNAKFIAFDETYREASYVDSISGGDFTATITSNDFLKDRLNRYKIIESALTKILIIDERIFGKYSYKNELPDDFEDTVHTLINSNPEINSLTALIDWIRHNYADIRKDNKQKKVNDLMGKLSEKYLSKVDTVEKLKQEEQSIIEFCTQLRNGMSVEKRLLNRKNIFLYNLDINEEESSFKNLNNMDCGKITENITIDDVEKNRFEKKVHFMTIHLGLLEKYRDFIFKKIKEKKLEVELNGKKYKLVDKEYKENEDKEYKENNETMKKKEENGKKKSPEEQVKSAVILHIMEQLKTEFGAKFIAIHSGRGNFSADLEDDLKDYPFISLSALEAAFDNSKYFLSQLFYNTIYYGKGNFNKQ